MDRNFEPGRQGFDIETQTTVFTLRDRFIVPPFSVLDARMSEWQSRKRAWIKTCKIQSELGRGENALKFSKTCTANYSELLKDKQYQQKATLYQSQSRLNEIMSQRRKNVKGVATPAMSGTSIFDPVLCELAYTWWCTKNGSVLDPFAGGSVRGIVAVMTGHNYTGIELSKTQINANIMQWAQLKTAPIAKDKNNPMWIHGDSADVLTHACKNAPYDFLFSCPPYGNLEKYSDDHRDISNMAYEQFFKAYLDIIKKSTSLLNNNRFACFVVGDFRDKKTGLLQNFISDTIYAFQEAGLVYYSDAVLITMVGSLPIRAGRAFVRSRKLGRTHQNVLVFYKGDPKTIPDTFYDDTEKNGN